MLSREHWLQVVQRTPLISIDLILRDRDGRVLLGLRNNEPAKGTWFVPGGVIRKNELLDQAFARIAANELGVTLARSSARLKGVYEHHYSTNFAGVDAISTHYVVLAHEIDVPQLPQSAPLDQHRELRPWTVADLLVAEDVHPYTQAYFR